MAKQQKAKAAAAKAEGRKPKTKDVKEVFIQDISNLSGLLVGDVKLILTGLRTVVLRRLREDNRCLLPEIAEIYVKRIKAHEACTRMIGGQPRQVKERAEQKRLTVRIMQPMAKAIS